MFIAPPFTRTQLHELQQSYIEKSKLACNMTLRDYFAAKAMVAFLIQDVHTDTIAEYAYKAADAMLEARSKT